MAKRKPTIEYIRNAIKEKSPLFFSMKNLLFFGQSMAGFKVAVSPKGNIYVYAKGYDYNPLNRERRFVAYTFVQFKNSDLKHIRGRFETLKGIKEYIRTH